MTMLYPEEFWATYGSGTKVYDATGRLLRFVVACNPKTGEVITHDMPLVAHVWHRLLWPRTAPDGPFRWRFSPYLHPPGYGYLDRRHGFWPAPLLVVPKPIWNGDPEQYAPVPRRSAAEREQLL